MPFKNLATRREYDKAWKRQSRRKDASPLNLQEVSLNDPRVQHALDWQVYHRWYAKDLGVIPHG